MASPFLWVASELLRSRLGPLSFPWDLLGYVAAHNLALAQVASVTGVYGLSFLVAAYGALLIWFLRAMFAQPMVAASSRRRADQASRPQLHSHQRAAAAAWLGATLALIGVAFFGPRWVPQVHPSAVAHLVQTNLPMLAEYPADWDAQHSGDMAQIEGLSIAAGVAGSAGAAGASGEKGPGLIVWPEVPAPFSMQRANFVQRAERIARDSRSDFLVGVIDWKPAPMRGKSGPDAHGVVRWHRTTARRCSTPPGREKFLYDKIRLVPFSEFVPGRNFCGWQGPHRARVRFSEGHAPRGGGFARRPLRRLHLLRGDIPG